VITGLPAVGYEPHTGLPYATNEAREHIHRLVRGVYPWREEYQAFASQTTPTPIPSICPASTYSASMPIAVQEAMTVVSVEMLVEKLLSGKTTEQMTQKLKPSKERSIYVESASDEDEWSSATQS
jgi:hypothetical protein